MRTPFSIFSEIPRKDWKKVISSFFFLFFLMFAYYIAKPVREGLTLEVGAKAIPFLNILVISSIAFVNVIYDKLVRIFSRRKLGITLNIIFITIFIMFGIIFNVTKKSNKDTIVPTFSNDIIHQLSLAPEIWIPTITKKAKEQSIEIYQPDPLFLISDKVSIPLPTTPPWQTPRGILVIGYFVWVSIFILFGVAILWSFINDIFTAEQGKKLFGIIGAGGPAGALAGSTLTSLFVRSVGIGNLLYVSSFFILLSVISMLIADSTMEEATTNDKEILEDNQENSKPTEPNKGQNGLKLIFQNPYLIQLSLIVIFYTFSQNVFYYKYAELVQDQIGDTESRTQLFASMYRYVNIIGISIQFLLTGWILTSIGVFTGLMLLPISELIGYGLFITNSPIPWITWGIIVTLAITYSINNAAKEVLYTAGPRSFKYQAKGIIETFFFRTGDVSGALSIILFTHVFAMPGYEIFVLLGIVFLFRVWIINLICSRFNKGQIVANKDSLNQETTTDNTTLE